MEEKQKERRKELNDGICNAGSLGPTWTFDAVGCMFVDLYIYIFIFNFMYVYIYICVCVKYYAMLKAPLIAETDKTVVGTWGKQYPTGTGFQHVDGVERIWNLGVGRMHWNCGSR